MKRFLLILACFVCLFVGIGYGVVDHVQRDPVSANVVDVATVEAATTGVIERQAKQQLDRVTILTRNGPDKATIEVRRDPAPVPLPTKKVGQAVGNDAPRPAPPAVQRPLPLPQHRPTYYRPQARVYRRGLFRFR